MLGHIDPEAKCFLDAALPPILKIFEAEIAKMRARGADDAEVEEFLVTAVDTFPGELEPVAAAYVVGKLREAAVLPAQVLRR